MCDKTLRDHRTRRKSTMPTLLSALMSFLLLTLSLPASAIGQLSETSALPYAPASEQMRVLADFGNTADVVLRDGDYLLSEHSGTALIALPEDGDMASAVEYYSDVAEKASADGLLSADAKSAKTASTSTSATASSSSEKTTKSEPEMDADESIALVPAATSDVNPLAFLPAAEDESVATSEEPAPASGEETTPAEPNAPPLVAIIDTGVSADIPVEFRSSVLAPQDPKHPEDWGLDDNGHGTAVAEAILGENPAARLMSIKALDDAGYGSVSGIYAAIELAVANGADIINLSLSGRAAKGNEMLEEAVADAIAAGAVVIASAGNGGHDAKYYTPANIDDVFTVGAANEDGTPRADSNRGKLVNAYVSAESTSLAARVSGMASLYPGAPLGDVAVLLLPAPMTADGDGAAVDVPVAAAEEGPTPSETVSIDVPTSAATPAIKTSDPSSAEDDMRAVDAVKAESTRPADAAETSEKAATAEEQEKEEETASTSQATEKLAPSKASDSDTTKLQAASTSTSSPRRAPAAEQYTVTFDLNGNNSASAISDMTTEDGRITLPLPSQNASLFLYWTEDRDGEGTPLMPGEAYTPTASSTLYAQWLDEALMTGITTENSSQLLLSALLTALVAMAAALLIRNGSRKTTAILR